MLWNAARILLLGAGVAVGVSIAAAHDSWINKGGYRNAAGEWCCGENDCESPAQIASTGLGWVVNGLEFIQRSHAQPRRQGLDLPTSRQDAPLRVRTAAQFLNDRCAPVAGMIRLGRPPRLGFYPGNSSMPSTRSG